MWAKAYIVTNSYRYIQTAQELGIKNVVSSRPTQLIAVVEQLSGPLVSDSDLVRLLESPLVVGAVNELWADLDSLLNNGISLAGKSLVRLRRDLDSGLHTAIAASNDADENSESKQATDEYVQLTDTARDLGYGVHPMAEMLRELLSSDGEKSDVIRELEKRMEETENAIAQFGKKKQRYLRRVMRGKTDTN